MTGPLTHDEAVARLRTRHSVDDRRPIRLPTPDRDGRYPVAVIDGWHNPHLNHRHLVECPGLVAGDVQSHLTAIGLFALLAEQRPELHAELVWLPTDSGRLAAAIDIDAARIWATSSQRWANTARQGVTAADNAADELVAWLLYDYQPTPMISPWNGGSGLGLGFTAAGAQKSSTRTVPAVHAVAELGARTAAWDQTLTVAAALVDQARAEGWTKPTLITQCHNWFPDPRWVAACWTVRSTGDGDSTLVSDRTLGTGGNIGSGDLAAIAARRVVDVCTDPRSEGWLLDTLSGNTATTLIDDTPAHLGFPGLVNPWRWLLAVEGLIAVASINAWLPAAHTRASRCLTPGGTHDPHAPDVDNTLWLPTWDHYRTWTTVREDLARWLRWRGRDARTTTDAFIGNRNDTMTGWSYPIAPRNGQNPVILAGSPPIRE